MNTVKQQSATETNNPMMDAAVVSIPDDKIERLTRDGDNAKFVVEDLMPRIGLPRDVVQVIRWAYGYDRPPRPDGTRDSYEHDSDGSTVVADFFMGSTIKEPMGVGHDWLFSMHRKGLALPNGERWGFWKCNWWYARAQWYFGYKAIAVGRYVGLSLFGGPAWWGWWTNFKAVRS